MFPIPNQRFFFVFRYTSMWFERLYVCHRTRETLTTCIWFLFIGTRLKFSPECSFERQKTENWIILNFFLRGAVFGLIEMFFFFVLYRNVVYQCKCAYLTHNLINKIKNKLTNKQTKFRQLKNLYLLTVQSQPLREVNASKSKAKKKSLSDECFVWCTF